MKIYIITIDDVFEFEGFTHKPIVKTTEEEARKELERLYKSAKETYTDEFDNEERSDTSFSLFPDGYWGTSHYDARINEVEVEIPLRYEHIASITERYGNGESFGRILHSGTPERLAKEIVKSLRRRRTSASWGSNTTRSGSPMSVTATRPTARCALRPRIGTRSSSSRRKGQ